MNPAIELYMEPPVSHTSSEERLGDSVNSIIMDAVTAEGRSILPPSSKHHGTSEFSCTHKRLPTDMTSPTKVTMDDASEASSIKDCGNDQMSTTSEMSHKSTHTTETTNSTMTLKTMLRRTSWNNNSKPAVTVEQLQHTTLSLESAARQRFTRRNSYVSDMVVARSSRPQQEAAPDNSLGYDTHEPDAKRPQSATTAHPTDAYAPPAKRRRYQRRNSFYIPETSRSPGQTSGFSWKAMDFIYGMSSSNSNGTHHSVTASTNIKTTTPVASLAD